MVIFFVIELADSLFCGLLFVLGIPAGGYIVKPRLVDHCDSEINHVLHGPVREILAGLVVDDRAAVACEATARVRERSGLVGFDVAHMPPGFSVVFGNSRGQRAAFAEM